ncbi:MAG TPA: 16S rRNA (uracil(1498)-N(3))-methyltransferase [Burkholderiales bacterium]|nr:16S rRNA (uracil(1498)-N(3))-methyltransferase [Burkholderiales bacterium]
MRERPGRVPRLYLAAELRQGARVALAEEQAHHVARVLRLREGDAAVLFDGRGGEFEARLFMPGRGRVLAEIGARRALERESPLGATLVQGVSGGDRMDFTVQKAVELGVAAIQPVLAEKSVVRLDAAREAKKLAHWRRVAVAACEQCGRNTLPEIREPLPLARYRPEGEGARILLSPGGSARLADQARPPIVLAAGPEGGFSDDEESRLVAADFVRVRLGPRVLRTETAALAALAALNALAGDF